jgi:hypothetical protein
MPHRDGSGTGHADGRDEQQNGQGTTGVRHGKRSSLGLRSDTDESSVIRNDGHYGYD